MGSLPLAQFIIISTSLWELFEFVNTVHKLHALKVCKLALGIESTRVNLDHRISSRQCKAGNLYAIIHVRQSCSAAQTAFRDPQFTVSGMILDMRFLFAIVLLWHILPQKPSNFLMIYFSKVSFVDYFQPYNGVSVRLS